MSDEKDLADYRALLEKVSAKFSEIYQRNQSKMACGKGCSACCAPDLSVFAVERENIKRFLESQPKLISALQELESEDPFHGARCPFLDKNGACGIYEVRPVVCRSHGAPIFVKTDTGVLRDVCTLNFMDVQKLDEIPAEDFMNLDLLNQLLALINQKLLAEPNDPSQVHRYPLSLRGILEQTGSNDTATNDPGRESR